MEPTGINGTSRKRWNLQQEMEPTGRDGTYLKRWHLLEEMVPTIRDETYINIRNQHINIHWTTKSVTYLRL